MLRETHLIQVVIHNHPRLAEFLKSRIDRAILAVNPAQQASVATFRGYRMNITINAEGTTSETDEPSRMVLMNKGAFEKFCKLIALHNPDADLRPRGGPEQRTFWYNIEYLNLHPDVERQRIFEAELAQPFLDNWWNGYGRVNVTGATDENLANNLRATLAGDKWQTASDYIATMSHYRDQGVAALNANQIEEALRLWKTGLETFLKTCGSEQGRDFMWSVDDGSRSGIIQEVFHLYNDSAAANLRLGSQCRTSAQRNHLKRAEEEAGLAVDWSQMPGWSPTIQQRVGAHFRRAQIFRLLSDRTPRYLDQAESELVTATRLVNGAQDPELELELSRIRYKQSLRGGATDNRSIQYMAWLRIQSPHMYDQVVLEG